MNRCTHRLLASLALLAVSISVSTLPAGAQTSEATPQARVFPTEALRGEMVVLSTRDISIDGKPDRLTVGSRIRDGNNMLVMTGPLMNQKLVVNYLREGHGDVHQVWILNREEAREKRAGASTGFFNFGFAPAKTP